MYFTAMPVIAQESHKTNILVSVLADTHRGAEAGGWVQMPSGLRQTRFCPQVKTSKVKLPVGHKSFAF
jgi:hypothetical protein